LPAQILELIDKLDNVEVVRNQIAAILTVELAHQAVLSGLAQPRVFVERTDPWGEFLEAKVGAQPIINVWFDTATYDGSASNIVERQKCEGTFNIDCYGYAVSVDDGQPTGGHSPGDQAAALECQRAVRMARNILMSAHYTYLGLRGLVWKRWPLSLSMFQPQSATLAVQRIVAGRLAFQVQFNEFSPQVTAETLETLSVEVFRAGTGELYLRADYAHPVPAEE
jgi:hypothetical protein